LKLLATGLSILVLLIVKPHPEYKATKPALADVAKKIPMVSGPEISLESIQKWQDANESQLLM
jgi:hypothetical protein